MKRLRPLKAREVLRVLHALGFVELPKRGKGSHVALRNAQGRFTTVSWPGGSEQIPVGTMKAILDDVGLTWEEFEGLLYRERATARSDRNRKKGLEEGEE